MNPLDAATADVAQRLGVLYGADDWWSKDPAAKELMEKVKAGGGRVWMIEGGHVDLSQSRDSPFVCRYMPISCSSAHREASTARSQLAADGFRQALPDSSGFDAPPWWPNSCHVF